MLYLISIVIAFLLIFIETIFQILKKKNNPKFFFLIFNINFLLKFNTLFFFIFLIVGTFLIISFLYNNYLFNFISSFSNFFEDIYFCLNPTTYCAGVSKLVELANYVSLNSIKDDYSNTKLYFYMSNSEIKTLSKYNFDLLDRNTDFFKNRETVKELEKICKELNFLYNQNVKLLNQILNDIKNINNDKDLLMVKKKISLFYFENLFKNENLRLCNKKIGIPLYQSLYQKPFYSKEFLPIFLKSKIDEAITRVIICSFLSEIPLSKNLNYFDIKLSIVLGKNERDSLIILKQNKTIDAKTLEGESIEDQTVLSQKIENNKVISKIFLIDENKESVVIDQSVVSDSFNESKAPALLIGGQGIVEKYFYFTECMLKTKSQLNNSNAKIVNLYSILSKENFEKSSIMLLLNENSFTEELDFTTFYKSRIIEKTIVPNSRKFFENEEVLLNEKIKSRFKEIDTIFLRQLKRDSTIFKDIYIQKSNMHVNFIKLKKIMNDPELKEFFDNRVKTRIINASNGIFDLKRPPT